MARKKRRATGKRRLTKFNKCIGAALRGKHYTARGAARAAFKKAVKKCK